MKESKTIGHIYKITNPVNQIYIGQSIDVVKREKRYKTLDCKSQSLIYESIFKYGWDNHTFEIIHTFDVTLEDRDTLEKYFIKKFKSFYYLHKTIGLNLTKGGRDWFGKKSKETIAKIKRAKKGYKHSEETKQKQRESHKGQVPWCKGKKFTAEHVKKIVETKRKNGFWKNKVVSDEQKAKQSKTMMGKVFSEEWKRNISLSAKSRKVQGGNKGVIAYNANKTIHKKFKSMTDALLYLGLKPHTGRMREAIKQGEKYHDKIWKYAN